MEKTTIKSKKSPAILAAGSVLAIVLLLLGFFGGIMYQKHIYQKQNPPLSPSLVRQNAAVNLPDNPQSAGIQLAVQQFQLNGILDSVTETDKKLHVYRLSIRTSDGKTWQFDIGSNVIIVTAPNVIPSPATNVPPAIFAPVPPTVLKKGDALRILYLKDLTHKDTLRVMQVTLVK